TGQTDTMPLRVEKLFQEYNTAGAFAVASLLTLLSVVTLVIKSALEWQTRSELQNRLRESLPDEAGQGSRNPPPYQGGVRGGSETARRQPPPSPLLGKEGVQTEDSRVGISVKNVTKRFNGFVALDNVSVEVPHGSLLALLG